MPEDINKSTPPANESAQPGTGPTAAPDSARPILAPASELKKHKTQFNKPLMILAGILLVLALCAIGMWAAQTFKPEEEAAPTAAPSTATTLIGKTSADVQRVTVHPTAGEEYTLIKDSAGNYALDPMPEGGFTMNTDAAASIFSRAAMITTQLTAAEAPADTAQFGFDAPSAWYDVTYADGSTAKIILGDKSPTTSYYLMLEGDPNVYAVYSSVANTMNTQVTALHTVALPFTIDTASVSAVTLERAGQDTIEIRTRGEEEISAGINAYKLVRPFEYDADSENLTTLTTNIAAIALTGYAGNNTAEHTFGLDAPSAVITLTDANGTYTIKLGDKSEDGAYTYASIDDSAAVYTVQTPLVSFVDSVSVANIVDRFSNIINIVNVDSIDVTTPDGAYALSIERVPEVDENGEAVLNDKGEQVVNEVFYFNGEETAEDSFKALYQEIIGVLVNGLTDDYALTTPAEVTVTYNLNLAELPTITVEYFEYDRDHMAVRRDGHTYFYVRKDRIQSLTDALANYAG